MKRPISLNWSPIAYDAASVIANEAGAEMLSRLEFMMLAPKVVLDLGCGTGKFTLALHHRFPEAQILAVDADAGMLAACSNTISQITPLCASLEALPIPPRSVDLIFANQLLPWVDQTTFIQVCKRLLCPEGLLIFSSLGLDTLQEYQSHFSHLDVGALPRLDDMHNIGDALLQAGFVDVVLDVHTCTLAYQDKTTLFSELKATGMLNVSDHELASLAASAELRPVTYEVILGHAFAPIADTQTTQEGVTAVPLSALRGRRHDL